LSPYTYTWIAASIACLALTPVVRCVALRVGAVARPGDRSVHTTPVPHLGGVALFLAFLLSGGYFAGWNEPGVLGVLVGGALILVVGVIDDVFNLPPSVKLGGMVLAAYVLTLFGVCIDHITNPFDPAGPYVFLANLSMPLTILWVVCCVNVMNLIDGLDGLAAGISSIACFILLFAAVQTGQPHTAIILVAALGGASLGFLPFNFNPARIFMGDAGSMFIGYTIGAISVLGTLKSTTVVALGIPVLALGLPVFDTCLAIVRRWRAGRPISQADRDHLHHKLLQMGLSQREVVLIMYFISGWLGISALALIRLELSAAVGMLGFVFLSLYMGARKAGMLDSGKGEERH